MYDIKTITDHMRKELKHQLALLSFKKKRKVILFQPQTLAW